MDKLKGIKPGDRVRVAFEGVVQPNQAPDRYALYIAADGRDVPNVFHNRTVAADTFHVERIEKPLEVGDKVIPAMPSHCYGELLAISGTKAWVFWEHNRSHATLDLSGIVRRPEYR